MDLTKTLEKINYCREKTESAWIFCLWKDPELFADYPMVNEGKDKTLRHEDSLFYFGLGKAMYKQGFRKFDNMTIETFIKDKPNVLKRFEEHGGYEQVQDLMSLVNTNNVDAYFDEIIKINSLSTIAKKCEEIFSDVNRFSGASSEDVYNAFQLLIDSAAVSTGSDTKIENLVIDDDFIEECDSGEQVGLNYGEALPILNYITLGLPLGDMTMLAGHSGVGKSSFVFENFVLPLNNSGVKCAIISNEMRSSAYKSLLTMHILTQECNYWDLTRKKLKTGHFTDEQRAKLGEVKKISKEKYSNIAFVKLYDNNIEKVIKYIKKLAGHGYQCIIWDTMKSDDVVDEAMWQQLTLNSRRIFNVASKYNIAIVPTYQLALHTQNQRFLDATCLSNAKQIKEVFSEMIYLRTLWDDEYPGKKYDIKPYKLKKLPSGKTTKVYIENLDNQKKYAVAFVDKTRNDEDKQQVLLEWNGRYNRWIELARCTVVNDHRT